MVIAGRSLDVYHITVFPKELLNFFERSRRGKIAQQLQWVRTRWWPCMPADGCYHQEAPAAAYMQCAATGLLCSPEVYETLVLYNIYSTVLRFRSNVPLATLGMPLTACSHVPDVPATSPDLSLYIVSCVP